MSKHAAPLARLQILDFDVISKEELWTSILLKKPSEKGESRRRTINSPQCKSLVLLISKLVEGESLLGHTNFAKKTEQVMKGTNKSYQPYKSKTLTLLSLGEILQLLKNIR